MFGSPRDRRSKKRSQLDQVARRFGPRRLARQLPRFELLEQREMLTGNTYTPTVFSGTAAGSLPAAIALANADAGTAADTIQLAAGTYALNVPLTVSSTAHTLTIAGAASGGTVIDETALARVFQVNSGVTVVFQNVTIEGGTAETDTAGGTTVAEGGGLLNLGTATLNNVDVFDNSALATLANEGAYGGGIYNAGTLTIESTGSGSSLVDGNQALAGAGGNALGGGIFSDASDSVSITGTTIGGPQMGMGNVAQGGAGANGGTGGYSEGGGLCLVAGVASTPIPSLVSDTVQNNQSLGGQLGAGTKGGGAVGGGVYIGTFGGVSMQNDTVDWNEAVGGNGTTQFDTGSSYGGGVFTTAPGTLLYNDTIYGNQAGSDTKSLLPPLPFLGNAVGGGVTDFITTATGTGLTMVNDTVTDNSALSDTGGEGGAGGLYSENDDQRLQVQNSIIAGNKADLGIINDLFATANTTNNNIIGDSDGATGFSTANGDLLGATAAQLNLGPLANNGGGVATVALGSSSVALGYGNVAAAQAAGLSTDARGTGYARFDNATVDDGAFEFQGATTTTLSSNLTTASYGQPVTFTVTVTPQNGASGAAPTGTVQFYNGGSPINGATVTLVNGTATYTAPSSVNAALPPGTNEPITAIYSGDASFSTGTPNIVDETINPAATTTVVTGSPNPVTYGAAATFTATVSPTMASGSILTPTGGSVEFFENGTPVASELVTVVAGVAQATFTGLPPASSYAITAQYTSNAPTQFANSPVSNMFVENVNPPNGNDVVSLSNYYNVQGITVNGVPFSSLGGLDGNGNALSASLVGSSITWSGLAFPIGPATVNNRASSDVVAASGQKIALAPGYYASIDFLGMGTLGSQPNQNFIVTYTNGTTATVTQGLSDWGYPQGYAGESVALSTSYRNTSSGGRNNGTFNVYGYSLVNPNPSEMIASITLPNNNHVKILSLTAVSMTIAKTPVPGSSVAVSLAGTFNQVGITTDGRPVTGGGLDGAGNALSARQLGTSQTVGGVTFTIGAAGSSNIVQATGQTLSLAAGKYSKLELLATSVNGNQANQTFVVHYTDGSSQTFTQSLSDWAAPQHYSGETVAVSMPYRNTSSGSPGVGTFDVYEYTLAINSGKTIASITLPNDSKVKVLAMTLVV
jgi:Bacterial Ig-like domain (group 3)